MAVIIGRASNPRGGMKRHSNPLYGGSTKKRAASKKRGKTHKGRKFNPSLGGVELKHVLITSGIVAAGGYVGDLLSDMINENVFVPAGLTGISRAMANIGVGAAVVFAGCYADKHMRGSVPYSMIAVSIASAAFADGMSELLVAGDAASEPTAAPATGYVPGMRGFVPGMTGHSGHAYTRMDGFRTMSQLGLDPLPHTFAHPTSMQGSYGAPSHMQGYEVSRMQGATQRQMC
jgi:hypothetical protein